jgi:hypothetical protein
MNNFEKLVRSSWNNFSLFSRLVKSKEFIYELKEKTSFLDQNYVKIRNKHRAYVVVNGLTEAPLCLCGCGLPANLNQTNPEQGFRDFYNNDHALTYKKPKVTKEELFHHRITLQKSIEQIAKDLGIGEVSVRNKLKEFKFIELFDARQRNLNANKILQSKEELNILYDSELTTEEIAKKLNTTKGTVSRWLAQHGIETRNSNSYERKIKKISNEEQELFSWLSTVYCGELIQSNRSILNGKELDIYIPEKNIAIEYNGLYSHIYRPWEIKDSLIKGPKYHLQKTLECEKQGIQLLQFFSDEWKYKKEIVQSIIKSKLGLCQKIYARKCKIREIDTNLKNSFLNKNHIQGQDRSKVKFGLFYGEILVSVMTFCKSRFNKNFEWELSRFSCLKDYTIVGGFSKLLKYFTDKYGREIVSYADRRISNGNVYKQNGFELIRVNKSSYFYVDKNYIERHNRMKFQKKNIGAYNCTEYEKAREMGFDKIWDCGSLCFGLK